MRATEAERAQSTRFIEMLDSHIDETTLSIDGAERLAQLSSSRRHHSQAQRHTAHGHELKTTLYELHRQRRSIEDRLPSMGAGRRQ